jgi:hypothetical protein
MEALLNQGVFQAIVVASFVTFFRAELAKIIRAGWGYINRVYPVGSKVELFNPASGHYEDHVVEVIKYKFSLSGKKRGVTILHPEGKAEKLSILAWLDMRKRPA